MAEIKDGKKFCTYHEEWHDLSDYDKNKSNKDGYQHTCKTARAEGRLRRGHENPITDEIIRCPGCKRDLPRSEFREAHLKRRNITNCKVCRICNKRGITIEQYFQMFKDQDNKCLICNLDFSLPGVQSNVDHNHETNQVRGILCNKCNTAVGLLKEKKENFIRAVEYLEKYEKLASNQGN